MKTKSIRLSVAFTSTPGKVYQLIMDQKETRCSYIFGDKYEFKINGHSVFLKVIAMETILN